MSVNKVITQPVDITKAVIQPISDDMLHRKNVAIDVLRLDLIHPVISGNKWFKLKYWIEDAKAKYKDHILTFGGAHSNHIVAVAAAGRLQGLKTTGIIRGEQPENFSATLQQAMEYGMELIFVSREDYRTKKLPVDANDEIYIILIQSWLLSR